MNGTVTGSVVAGNWNLTGSPGCRAAAASRWRGCSAGILPAWGAGGTPARQPPGRCRYDPESRGRASDC